MNVEKQINEYMEEVANDKKTALLDLIIVILVFVIFYNVCILISDTIENYEVLYDKKNIYNYIEDKGYECVLFAYHELEGKDDVDIKNCDIWVKLGMYIDRLIKHDICIKNGNSDKAKECEMIIKEIEKDELLKLKTKEIKEFLKK